MNQSYILIFDSKHRFVRIPFLANTKLTYIRRYVHESTFVYVPHNIIVTYLQIKVRRIVNYGTVPYSSVQYNTEPISIQFYGCTVLMCINICTYVRNNTTLNSRTYMIAKIISISLNIAPEMAKR